MKLAESFANPFIDNAAPIWQFPGQPANSKVCQNNLEEGDPIEVLANATTPITVQGRTVQLHLSPSEHSIAAVV